MDGHAGLPPVEIVDAVANDTFAQQALNASATQWVQQQLKQLSVQTLYGIQGAFWAGRNDSGVDTK